ncbi:hypothetical protein [Sulfurospirillum sp. MES]|uniref:hypothetical protein n=1 Tax=Sulfurospirillum sp. MES TaxID=1565314 RepID=UPI000543F4B1|nr:hypothetical protein [Sulfurospirillum sp. MES]KHG32982.1 MAG: hypothetical protein OA34_12345 [Sulfurospirillum sp. MES]
MKVVTTSHLTALFMQLIILDRDEPSPKITAAIDGLNYLPTYLTTEPATALELLEEIEHFILQHGKTRC